MGCTEQVRTTNDEAGFTLIEVAVAAIITTIGLVFLAGLFTLAIAQNKNIKQFTSTTLLAQQKLEELNAIERLDPRLDEGGGLKESQKENGYYDSVYVDDAGTITTAIPEGETPNYMRYWKVEPDPEIDNAVIISVRVVALYASRGRTAEETTLTTVRSW
jgi:type II secretory pathway pseudopilin PulG